MDKYACIKINGFCDDVMRLLMQKLKLKIPEMRLVRRIGSFKKILKFFMLGT